MREHEIKYATEGRKKPRDWDKKLKVFTKYLIGFVTGVLFSYPTIKSIENWLELLK